MSKYWIAKGKLCGKLADFLKRLNIGLAAMRTLAKQHGSKTIGHSSSPFTRFCVYFEGDLPPLWKRLKGSKACMPRMTSKEGKEIGKQIRELERQTPDGNDLANFIGMAGFNGCSWKTPGLHEAKNGKFIIVTPDEFTPKRAVANQLKRISDIEYEKLIA